MFCAAYAQHLLSQVSAPTPYANSKLQNPTLRLEPIRNPKKDTPRFGNYIEKYEICHCTFANIYLSESVFGRPPRIPLEP